MTVHFFAGRSTINRLHAKVQRNILRNHQARYESTKQSTQNSRNTSNGSHSENPTQGPQQRTIPTAFSWVDPFMKPFRGYSRMQQRSPLMTQVESTILIYYLGDLCSQTVSSNVFIEAQYEPIRGVRAMLIGSIASIPGYKWFIFLGNHFNYKSHILSIAVKVCVNQTLFTPLFNTYFFGMQTLLAGGSWADAKERVINTVPTSWKNSWKVWPAVTAFNFTYVPWQYRNVFAGVIAVFWQTYLSWLNRNEERRVAMLAESGKVQQQEIKRIEEPPKVQPKPKPAKKKTKKRKAEDQEKEQT